MKTKVTTSSWHYSFLNSTINKAWLPNWFIEQNKIWTNHSIPTDHCSYWNAIFKYILIQIPAMLFIGCMLGSVIAAELYFLTSLFQFGFSTTMIGLSNDFFITIAMGTNMVMGTFAFVGALLYGATWLSRKDIKVKLPESTFVKDSWKALKDKYCLQLEFVDNNGEPLKYDTTGGYLSNIKHPWGWLVERPRMTDKTNFVSVGDNQYITEEQFRLKFPDRKIMFNTDWLSRNPDFDDKEKNVEWDVYQKEREEKQNDFEPW